MSEHLCRECSQKLPQPDRISNWYMLDCHLFVKLPDNPREAAKRAKEVVRKPEGAYGMLCGPILMLGDKEVRRLGTGLFGGDSNVHAESHSEEDLAAFDHAADRWVETVMADPDVQRLVSDG